MRRILIPAVLIVAAAVVYLISTDSGSRADRRAAQRAADLNREGSGPEGATDVEGIADAARIDALIRKYGGFSSKGTVALTLPQGPGVNLDVVLRVNLDGALVEARAQTDAEGKFALGSLPRASGYALTVNGPRVQPFAQNDISVEAAAHDFGELTLDRYYFVNGRVSSEGNRAVRGAAVALIEGLGTQGFSFLAAARTASVRDSVVASVATANDGRFSLRLKKPGMFTLGVRAEGWAPHYRTNLVVDARAESEQDIELTRGYAIVGYVFDGAGRPVPEAAVAIYAMRGWWFGGAAKELERTDDAGRFEFQVEPYNARYSLRVIPPKGIDITRMIDLPLENDLILRLPGTGVLTGRVISAETQQPLAGADVLIGLADSAAAGWAPDYGDVTRTNEYGVFRIEGVGKGFLHSLSIRADGYEQVALTRMFPSDRALWNRLSKIPLTGEAEVGLGDIPLKRGRVLVGTVKDAGTGRPVPGATVEMRDFVMGDRVTETDGNGMYRFDGVGPRVSMGVKADGYAPATDGGFMGVALPAGEKRTIKDFELQPGGVIRGTVADLKGNRLKGALVRLESAATGRGSWMEGLQLQPFFAFTDEKGEYSFDGVPPLKVRARAELAGFDRGVSDDAQITPGQNIDKLKIVMPAAARFTGRVVSRAGGPVVGARVTVAPDPGAGADTTAQWRALSRGKSGYAGDNGEFTITDVPTGNVLVRIEADAFATTTVRKSGIKPGEVVTGLRLQLAPAFVITGRIVDPNGKALATGWIRASHTSSPDGEPTPQLLGARIENDGLFTLRNLPAGTYKVEVRLPGYPGAPQFKNLVRESVAAGTKNLVIKLDPADG